MSPTNSDLDSALYLRTCGGIERFIPENVFKTAKCDSRNRHRIFKKVLRSSNLNNALCFFWRPKRVK